MWDEIHLEHVGLDPVDGEAHAVDRDRTLACDVARKPWRDPEAQAFRFPLRLEGKDCAQSVDMPGDQMPAERVAERERSFQVHRAGSIQPHRAVERLARDVER